jgi:bacteriocin-like protein
MSNQPENEVPTSQELRQALLSQLGASQQAIAELSDEELEQIAGGTFAPIRQGDKLQAYGFPSDIKGVVRVMLKDAYTRITTPTGSSPAKNTPTGR